MAIYYLDLFKSPACSMQLGGSQRVLQRPRTFAKAFGQRRVGYPYASRPQKQRLCYTVKGDVAVVSSIGGLNSSGSPCTVVGVVPLVYSAPFYGVPRTWPRPNIRNEVGKVEPPITDSDTSTAVITVRGMLRVSATLYHTSPHHVLWRGAASACMTVPQSSLSRLFGTKTATTSSRTALQEICRNYHRVTAGALTQPRSAAVSLSSVCFFGGGQSSELLSSEVNLFHNDIIHYLRNRK